MQQSLSNVDPEQVQQILLEIDYPCSRDDLIKKAEEEGADPKVISTLQRIPDMDFNSPVEVADAIEDIE